MGCRYLKQDGSCSHYRLRPSICRTWPQIEYFGHPRILKGCGFKATPRDPNFDPFSLGEPPKKTNKLNIIKE
jgi:Fe-S-cluster containining protein